jgi:hypothetical protein
VQIGAHPIAQRISSAQARHTGLSVDAMKRVLRLNDSFPEVGGRFVGFKDDVSDALLSQTLQSLPFTPRRGTGVALAEVPEGRHTALSSCSLDRDR